VRIAVLHGLQKWAVELNERAFIEIVIPANAGTHPQLLGQFRSSWLLGVRLERRSGSAPDLKDGSRHSPE